MELHLLYPSNPLRRGEPDDLYAEEHSAALQLGFGASLFSFEEFLAGDFKADPSLGHGQTVLYRGWMLKPSEYVWLYSAISGQGAKLLTSPEQYERCHYLPGWHAQLKELTPTTYFLRESEDVTGRRDGVTRIIELGDGQVSDRKKWSPRQLLEILRD